MDEIYLKDRGGVQPDATDVVSDELVTYLDGVNMTLGTDKDPRYNEYKDFLNSIAEASILTIEPEQMSTGKYDDLDLTGEEDETTAVAVPDVPDSAFLPNGMTWEQAMMAMFFFNTPYNMDSGKIYDKEFCPVVDSQFTFPE